MIEFLEDIVKLFTNVEEHQPLPMHYRIIALLFVVLVSVFFVMRFF